MSRAVDLFATDLDGTLLGNPAATERFKVYWQRLAADGRPRLVYNTGRSVDDVLERCRQGELAFPDYLITSVGTEVHHVALDGEACALPYADHISEGWDRTLVDNILHEVLPQAERQPDKYQSPVKSSWYVEDLQEKELERLRETLRENGIDAQVVFSNNIDLDILPITAGKGSALAWLVDFIQVPTEGVVVSGDRGNDASMYHLAGVRGILVENAMPELHAATVGLPVFHATGAHAEGLLEGLAHFGVLAEIGDAHELAGETQVTTLSDLGGAPEDLNSEELAFVAEGYEQALAALRRNITPTGFSAASLADNEVTGTDVNYRSVWGRDGAVTLIYAVDTDEPDLLECSRKTLETLLAHTTANGQVPANVRIDSGEPDYSGVGGICAIDSAMWLVIALYHYVKHTEDFEFARRYAGTLQAIMHWLDSHDSNLDGLLEIPEASDWTDLFGRSYNVLYDEVLWYRANVCMGLLCEQLGECDQATRYHNRSQQIRGRLLHIFWPTTSKVDGAAATSFADRQFSLGDARYLIAEVSPFNYSWRCDVYGNILAYLFNVIDAPRARTALSFMWGCGVNDPWPVANLYPVVQAGDPDWRPYYTVNLLNLPHHYHNGGIWPLVGGMWVEFIDRLGYHAMARSELHKLARCCKMGRQNDWEFNEWYHGVTGRPMGMCFQAWSAATYIGAYRALSLHLP